MRKIIEDTFHTLWWVPQSSPPQIVTGYLRALDRAERALDADLKKYLPLWKLAVPAEFENLYPWDFSKFRRGERFVYRAIPLSEFNEVMAQVKRWGLDQYLKDNGRGFERRCGGVAGTQVGVNTIVMAGLVPVISLMAAMPARSGCPRQVRA